MFKRLLSMLIVVILLVGLSGCSAIFMNTYHSEQEFQGNEDITLDSNLQVIQNYNELRRLVFNMVNEHIESTEFVFSGYTGNAVTDVASVCNAVNAESAYGAYCVDYISYDLRQIVSSYEAKITISYLYTEEELQSVRTTSDMNGFGALLVDALRVETPKLVVKVNNGVADIDAVEAFIQNTIRNDPMSISYTPDMAVKLYDGNTSQKIYDIVIKYDESCDNAARLREMAAAVKYAVGGIDRTADEVALLAASEYLSGHSEYLKDADSTAYGALVGQAADSQGIACAFKAMCDALEIECMVVSGRMEKQDHYWNIVKIGGAYYHMDISLFKNNGGGTTLFLRDTDKQVNCWWDQSAYPDCEGVLTYDSVALKK